VGVAADLLFDSNGPITGAFTHAPSSSSIIINVAGVYETTFIVLFSIQNQFGFFLNGIMLPGGAYGLGSQANIGQMIFLANAGDVLTIQNRSIGALVLPAVVGGTQNIVNTSVYIIKLA
jgi:hypothetical protein